MAKGQQKTNKETKKPKKDTSTAKTTGSPAADAVRPTQVTAIFPRGKDNNKPTF